MKNIETKRLIMRPFEMTDVAPFSAICADEEVMRYIGGGVHGEAETKIKIKLWISRYREDGFGLLALNHKKTNEFIGFCGLIRQVVDNKKQFELGYRLARKYWGVGLATEAAMAVRDHAFNHLDIQALISIIHPENTQSKNVAKKVGMDLIKETIFQGVPVEIYGISKD